MNSHSLLEKSVNWLLNNSLQAAVLVLLVLAVQLLFKRSLRSRWRFALWWIVLARLLLPIGPESALSVFNFCRPAVQLEGPRSAPIPFTSGNPVSVSTPSLAGSAAAAFPEIHTTVPAPGENAAHASQSSTIAPTPGTNPPHSFDFGKFVIPCLATVWLAGAVILSGCVLAQVIRFRRKLNLAAQASRPCEPHRLEACATPQRELLDDCRREFGITREIELLETDVVASPALFGLFRLRLLLPRGMAEKFSPRELRYVFLHELAHVKRGDLWLNWLVTALQIVHWFNPLIWFAFARLRADRELACDELALLRAGDSAGNSYGQTIIKLLEGLSRPKTIPGLVGILEDKKQMRRRISMIANFRKPSRWSALAIVLVVCVAVVALTDAQTEKSTSRSSRGDEAQIGKAESGDSQSLLTSSATNALRPDLLGTVREKNAGPIAATVFISTAAPKVGTSVFCPSCYLDCRKKAKTDAEGNFKIESLDPQLTFKILVVAKGYKPKFVEKIDPAKGPANVQMEKMERADAAPDRSLRGRVVDTKGEPVGGAAVEMVGVWRGTGGGWGAIPNVDPLAVTDERGEFLLTARDPFDAMDIKVTARTFADKNFAHVASGAKSKDLVLTEGAMLKGRVLVNGKPLAGAQIGVSGVERQAGEYIGHFEVGTDSDGRFAFVNLPPNEDYWIYGTMDSMKEYGAIPIRKIHSTKDGETTDAGDLIIGPAHRLAGKVVLDDGSPIAPKTRMYVGRDAAWDSMQLTLGTDGSFDTPGIPAETISMSLRVKGYRISGQNASLEAMNLQLIGKMDRDITNFVFLLEKGPDLPRSSEIVGPETDWPQNRPLRGAEGATDHSREWKISGRVLDAETKSPIEESRITPGQSDQFDHVVWDAVHGFDATNGSYVVYVTRRNPQPILMAEADGYLPNVLFLTGRDATDADMLLQKGSGPSGSVIAPDGKPAKGATLVLLSGGFNQASLDSKGAFMTMWGKENVIKADADGKFMSKPKWGTQFVGAASPDGFAVVTVESLATNSTIALKAYGKVTGTLKRTSGPGATEELILGFSDSEKIGGINLNHRCTTDAQGRFAFEHVPAGNLRMFSFGPAGQSRRGPQTSSNLKEFELKPGQNLELTIQASDLSTNAEVSYQPRTIKRIAGDELKGVVLSPDGKPAADAQVALQVENQYLVLGRATFESDQMLREGLIVRTDADGRFMLPNCEGAKFLMALNEEGFAKIPVKEFKASPRLALQKWGRVEGSLRVHGHPATNEWISVGFKNSPEFQIFYQQKAFEAKTDDQGRFAFALVPPGEQTVSRRINITARSWSSYTLGEVDVKPGETVTTNFAPSGRIVIGKVDLGTNQLDFQYDRPILRTPMAKWMKRFLELKTDEERKALAQTDEAMAAMKNQHAYIAAISSDGSFRAEDIPPGKYEIEIQPHSPASRSGGTQGAFSDFVSTTEVVVPVPINENDNSTVDLGTVTLEKFTFPIPQQKSSVK